MNNAFSAQKTTRTTESISSPDSSAGSQGAALAPPACGIDLVDRAAEAAAPGVEGTLQMKAAPPPAGSDAGSRAENRTGLPDPLKAGVESLSGLALDDVRVHYNSSKPAQLQALAYTQGSEIHMAPGQERHLPHEAWHVVQQKRGHVQATAQLKGVNINDDAGLEHEASTMGAQALQGSHQNRNRLQGLPKNIDLHRVHSQQNRPTQGMPIQREVDTSSSPWLPEYEENEVPAWQDYYGVPDWAKEEYLSQSKTTVICSMSSDGKIGSVYFGQQGRIRTTHKSGPIRSEHEELTTVQFNIDESQAMPAFRAARPEKHYPHFYKKSKVIPKYYYRWLAKKLKDVTVDTAPPWAKLVEGPDTAYDLATGNPPENLQLLEIFKQVDGGLGGLHPSRGVAAKFATDKQTIAVLHAAIKYIDDKGITGAKKRNEAFYAFVKSRLPNFVSKLRHPDEIEYKESSE